MKGESREIKGRKSTGGGRIWYGKRETLTLLFPPSPPPSYTKLSFVTTFHLAVKNLKQILMEHRSLKRNQLLLKTSFQNIQSSLIKREHPLRTRLLKQKKKFEGDYAMRLQKSHGESVPVSLSLIRFQESKQDLIDSSLPNKRETCSG